VTPAHRHVAIARLAACECVALDPLQPDPLATSLRCMSRRALSSSVLLYVALLVGGCGNGANSAHGPTPSVHGTSSSSKTSESATVDDVTPRARLHTDGEPPPACAHAGGTTPPACVHALFHRYPNFASNSMCDPVATVARRLRNFGFEVSIREVSGSQPSTIVTNWWSGGTRGSVNLIVGSDNPSCGM
jgi:hypothetical protein